MVASADVETAIGLFQAGIWWAQSLEPTSPGYHGATCGWVRAPLDENAMAQAWQRFVDRHPILRTTYHGRGPDVTARRHDRVQAEFEVVDASALSDAELAARVIGEYRRPFKLTEGVVRLSLYRKGPAEYLFLGINHHIAFDLLSSDLMNVELPRLYADARNRTNSPLPSVDATYEEFVSEQRAFATSARATEELSWWRRALDGVSGSVEWPERARQASSYVADSVGFHLDAATWTAVQSLRPAARPLRTLLAVFGAYVARYTNQTDVLVGTPANCRGKRYESTVGNFINMLPIRVQIGEHSSFLDVAESVDRFISDAGRRRNLPITTLLTELRFPRVQGRRPLYQVTFQLNSAPRVPALAAAVVTGAPFRAQLGDLPFESFNLPQFIEQPELGSAAVELDGQLYMDLRFDTRVHDRRTVERMAEGFTTFVRALVRSPRTALRDLPVLPDNERALRAWTERLRRVEALDAPDGPRHAEGVVAKRLLLSREETRALRDHCASAGWTVAEHLRTLLGVLIGRCLRATADFVVYDRVDGRGDDGHFIPIVFPLDYLAADRSFADLVERLRQDRETLGRPLSTEERARLVPEGGLTFYYEYRNSPATKPDLAPASHRSVADYDVHLSICDRDECVELALDYNRARFSGLALLDRIRALAVTPSSAGIGTLDVVLPAEHSRLREWNATETPFPDDATVHELFEAQVRRTPEAIALTFADKQLTYRELDQRANQLAHHLRRAGVGLDVRVGLCLERSVEMVVGLLGILKAGGAYVPLDPSYPKERLSFMLEDAAAPVLLTQKALVAALPPHGGRVICVDGAEPELAKEPTSAPANATTATDLIYVIYTSGSTGRPKGAMNEHRAVVNRLLWMQQEYRLGADDRVLQKTPFSFDVSVWEFFWPLLVGARLVVARPGGHQDPSYLIETIRDQKVTTLHFVPSMLSAFLDARGLEHCKSLRRVVASGEALSAELVERFYERLDAKLHNLYGPTEAAVDVTHWTCERGAKVVPIGRPIANATIHVLDSRGSVAPIGVVGELHIGGVAVGRGYLNRPELTAERFVRSPFGRLYRTGDLARWMPDGNVEYLGRIDFQVKIRGFRIELGEIESAIAAHPSVRETAVIAREDGPNEKKLVAYVVGRNGHVDMRELRAMLQTRLPEHMVPSTFVALGALPLNQSGKLDRRALPAHDPSQAPTGSAHVAPRNSFEAQLCDIFADVLGVRGVGIRADFFQLGGHSLKALVLQRKLEDWLHLEVPIATLLRKANVEDLAEFLQALMQEPEKQRQTLPPLAPQQEHRFEVFPLTDMQQAYLLGRSEDFELGGVPAQGYEEFECIDLEIERLQGAFQRVIARHDMLRAVVLSATEQRVLPHTEVYRFKSDDLRGLPAEVASERIRQTREEMCHSRAPDPAAWPLFDVRVSRVSDTLFHLHFRIELLICDAWSAMTIFADWAKFHGDPNFESPPIEVTFRDYVLGQRELESHPLYLKAKDYWWARLDTLPPAPDLPLAPGMSTLPKSPRLSSKTFEMDKTTWERLQAVGARAGLTSSSIVCASFADVLGMWSKGRQFTINCMFYNRIPNHRDVEKLVGNFSSTSLLSIDGSQPNFEARAKAVQQQLWEDLNHSYIGGVRVIRELNRLRGGGTRPTMPVVFASTLPIDTLPQTAPDWPGKVVHRDMRTPQVLLDHQAWEEDGTLYLVWSYVDEAFPPGLVDTMFDAYCRLLMRLANEEPAWRATERRLLPASEVARHRELNATEVPVSSELMHEAVFLQAGKTPNAPAVVSADRRLTYAELVTEALAIGERLRARGVRPNQLVAIVMDKGWEQVVAALGILAAGAAYLPVDAALPAPRLRAVLEAGEVTIALTQPAADQRIEWPEGLARICVEPAAASQRPPRSHVASRLPAQANTDLAYVIFTSGTTGVPKGVMIDHRGAVNTIRDINRRFQVGPADRVLALSSLNFDLSVYDIFGLLSVGGTIVIPSQASIRDPASLVDLIVAERVTIWNSVPALLGLVTDFCAERGVPLAQHLRLVMLSGDWIPVVLPERVKRLNPSCQVVSLGGATEASIWSVWFPIDQVSRAWTSIPYGRPLENQRVHVLDDAMEERPTWVPGELYIGGIGLSLGYWKDKVKTNAAFRVHPATGERLYRTGDLARHLPEGYLEFLGREDLQVKIQGYRIELGDVEAALSSHPSVQNCVCVAQGERTNRRLVGYVVAKPEKALTPEELLSFAAERLPVYMVPSKIVMAKEFPLSANGKVDRVGLTKLDDLDEAHRAGFVAPRTGPEMRVALIFQEVLGLPTLSVTDEFFSIGGTSVHAVRIASRLEQAFGTRPSISSLLRGATVESVARQIQGGGGGKLPNPRLVVFRSEGQRPPLFFAHPIGGNVFCYGALARALGNHQPFYALQSRGLEEDETPHGSIEAMAAEYLTEIRRVLPAGPYRLGGWSMGGLIALEMAQQLINDGERVDALSLVETPLHVARESSGSADGSPLLLARDLEGLSGKDLGLKPDDIEGLPPDAQRRWVLDRARAIGILPADLPEPSLEPLIRVFEANAKALRAYHPKAYAGRTQLIIAEDSSAKDYEGWRDIVSGALDIRMISGNHYTIVTPPIVEVLATELLRE